MPDTLTIRCFGSLEVRRAGRVLQAFPTRRAKLLFAYLALFRQRSHPRETLLGALWGDEREDMARKHLRTELHRLRRTLEPSRGLAGTILAVDTHTVALNPGIIRGVDVEQFETRLQSVAGAPGQHITPEQATLLRRGVELYRADLLEGVYEDWCLAERDRLKVLLQRALERLMAFHRERGDWAAAVTHARRLLECNPFAEHVHRELMRLLYAMGDRPAALREYQRYEAFLRRELGTEPMPESQRLHQGIVDAEIERKPTPSPKAGAAATRRRREAKAEGPPPPKRPRQPGRRKPRGRTRR